MYRDRQIIYVNSRNKQEGSTHEDFSISLDIDLSKHYDRVCMLSASIPKSFYIVQSNDYFILDEGGLQANITISAGNYTRNSLASSLQTALNTASPNNYSYTVNYRQIQTSYDDGKFYFTTDGIDCSFIFNTTMYEVLGFEPNETYNFSAGTLTSSNVVNLQKENVIYIKSDIVDEQDGILQHVYGNSNASYSHIIFENSHVLETSKKFRGRNNNISVYNFMIVNENGVKLQLNGVNWVCVLMLYKSDNINDVWRKYIEYKIN